MQVYPAENPELVPEIQWPFYEGSQVIIWLDTVQCNQEIMYSQYCAIIQDILRHLRWIMQKDKVYMGGLMLNYGRKIIDRLEI